MPWEDDEDSGSDPEIEAKREPRRERSPSPEPKKKPGRRRRAGDAEEEKGGDVGGDGSSSSVGRAVSGWGDGDGGGGFVRKAAGGNDGGDDMNSATKESGTAGKRKGRNRHFDNDGADDIMIIPDLDEDMGGDEDDITLQVAAAPKNTTRRVASLHELDSDLKYSVSSAENGIDLSLLTTNLVPPGKCHEGDEVWDFEGLLQSVTQEFHKERELDLDNEGGEPGGEGGSGAGGGGGADEVAQRKIADASVGARDLKEEDARKMDEVLGTGGGGKVRKESTRRRRNA